MTKRWLALVLAVLMLWAATGCYSTYTTKDDDAPTTTTTQAEQIVAPIELVDGKIPSDCLWCPDSTAPAQKHAVLLKANTDLTDLHFVALNPDPPTVDNTIYTYSFIDEGKYVAFYTYLNDAVPNRGVACTDKDGKTYYYAITYSGKDGSINLTEIKE